jgi:hypothetical protein
MKIVTFREGEIEKFGVMEDNILIDVQFVSDVMSDVVKNREFPVVYSMAEFISQWEEVKSMLNSAKRMFGKEFYKLFSVKRAKLGAQFRVKAKLSALAKIIKHMQRKQGQKSRRNPYYLENSLIVQ